ncbi:glycoside hydrolase family 32 protein [Pseudonocardia nigra]|uniref:glycoside hydrolase family 32 protein n=1 Tax=Pseudonocardia nigra TaxID=1921578 RepID=UPI001C5FB2DE|nr:glycoside hydrolase family 32 protein [Pseudonocardia nigra]
MPGGPDETGVWSGCTVDDAGTPTAVYSGVRDRSGRSAICLATGDDDLRTWKQEPEPVVAAPTGLAGFRDPFLFSHGGHRWALVGGGERDDPPFVELYSCDDLRSWRSCGRLLDGRHPIAARHAPADIWECPALVRLGEHWVLVVSLWVDGALRHVSWLSGTLVTDGDGLRLEPTSGGPVDGGSDFYAPTTLVDGDRVLMWGWSWESAAPDVVAQRGWAGVLTCPRELSSGPRGELRVQPAAELTRLRARSITDGTTQLAAGGSAVCGQLPSAAEVTVDLHDDDRLDVVLRQGEGRDLVVRVDPAARSVTLDRAGWPAAAPRREQRVPTAGPDCRLRVLLDDSVVEVFVDDRAAITERVEVLPGDRGVLELRAPRGPVEAAVRAWELVPPTTA